MSKRDDFQKTMEENLAVGDARLEALRGRTRTEAPGQRKDAQEKRIAELQTRAEGAAAKLEQLKTAATAAGDRWDVVKHEMAKEWHELESFMAKAESGERSPELVA